MDIVNEWTQSKLDKAARKVHARLRFQNIWVEVKLGKVPSICQAKFKVTFKAISVNLKKSLSWI